MEPGVTLILQLPAPLGKGTGRHQRFLARASHLILKVGESETTFPVEAWEHLSLPSLEGVAQDISVRIWDRDREGRVRRDPALKGKAEWRAGDAEVRIKLHLELSPREYD